MNFQGMKATYLDVPLEVRKWLGSMGYNLLINGTY